MRVFLEWLIAFCVVGGFVFYVLEARAESYDPLVLAVLQEANTESLAGKIAVAGVALDRVGDNRWPSTVKAVVRQPHQFTGMSAPIKPYTRSDIFWAELAVDIARRGWRVCGPDVFWFMRDDLSPKPEWTAGLTPRCIIGEHAFYGDEAIGRFILVRL